MAVPKIDAFDDGPGPSPQKKAAVVAIESVQQTGVDLHASTPFWKLALQFIGAVVAVGATFIGLGFMVLIMLFTGDLDFHTDGELAIFLAGLFAVFLAVCIPVAVWCRKRAHAGAFWGIIISLCLCTIGFLILLGDIVW